MDPALDDENGAHRPPAPVPRGWRPFGAVIRAIDGFSELTGQVVSWMLVALTGAMVFEVVSRYFFDSPTIWASDMSYMLYGSMFMLGAAYTLRYRGHIRTDILYNSFPERWQGVIDMVAYMVFFLPAFGFFLWFGWQSFYESWQLEERAITSPWSPVLYPFRAVVPVSAMLLLIQGISESLKSIHAVIYARWP